MSLMVVLSVAEQGGFFSNLFRKKAKKENQRIKEMFEKKDTSYIEHVPMSAIMLFSALGVDEPSAKDGPRMQ